MVAATTKASRDKFRISKDAKPTISGVRLINSKDRRRSNARQNASVRLKISNGNRIGSDNNRLTRSAGQMTNKDKISSVS